MHILTQLFQCRRVVDSSLFKAMLEAIFNIYTWCIQSEQLFWNDRFDWRMNSLLLQNWSKSTVFLVCNSRRFKMIERKLFDCVVLQHSIRPFSSVAQQRLWWCAVHNICTISSACHYIKLAFQCPQILQSPTNFDQFAIRSISIGPWHRMESPTMIEGPTRRIQSMWHLGYSSQNSNNAHGMLLELGGCASEGVSNYPETMNKSTLTLFSQWEYQIQPHAMVVFYSNLWIRGN